MKKRGKQVLVILFIGLILVSSVSIVSANIFTDLNDWLKDLFNIGGDSNLQGELGSLGLWEESSLIAYYDFEDEELLVGEGVEEVVCGDFSCLTNWDVVGPLSFANGYFEVIRAYQTASVTQILNLEFGEVYILSFEVLDFRDTGFVETTNNYWNINAIGSYTYEFTAVENDFIRFSAEIGGEAPPNVIIDDVSIKKTENKYFVDYTGKNDLIPIDNAKMIQDSEKGNVVELDGDGDYLIKEDVSDFVFDSNQDFAYSVWFKKKGVDAGAIMSFQKGSNGHHRLFINKDHFLRANINDGIDNAIATGSILVNDNQWHHVAINWDRDGEVVIYLDGVEEARGDISNTNEKIAEGGVFAIGATSEEIIHYRYFNGNIDEVKVFDRLLSEGEIMEIYEVGVEEGICGDEICDLNENITNCPEDCLNEEYIDFEISLATLKDEYNLGEKIELTDPPDEENIVEKIISETDLLSLEEQRIDLNGNVPNEILETDIAQNINQNNLVGQRLPQKTNGYIIQFEDSPILEQKSKLDKKAKKNEEFIEKNPMFSAISTYRLWVLIPEKVPKKVKDYSKDLEKSNKKLKEEVLLKIKGKRAKITGKLISEEDEIKIENEFTKTFNGISLDISEEEAEKIKEISGVKAVYPNLIVQATLMDSVPLINADDVWQMQDDLGNNITGQKITIAILDTGIDYTHKDLGNCTQEEFLTGICDKIIRGYDFVNSDADPMDDNGHGTHVAGIAAGNGDLKGVAPDAKLYAYKVLDGGGGGSFGDVMAGIERAIDPNEDGNFIDHVDVISMSLGAEGYYWCKDDDFSSSIINAINLGVVVVNSAGNDGTGGANTITYPGCIEEVITIGSSTHTMLDYSQISSFSSRGFGLYNGKPILKPDIVAPGYQICSVQWENAWANSECIDTEHTAISGTSMAAPHVSGAVALLKQSSPDLTPQEIKSILINNAADESFQHPNVIDIYTKLDKGAGLLDIFSSINDYNRNKLIVVPGSVSFGVFDLSQEIWSSSENIKIINNGDANSLAISIEGDFPEEINFEYPSSVFVDADSESIFEFKINVNNNIIDGNYEGSLIIDNGLESILVPFFFTKIHINVELNKELTSSDIKIKIHSDVPISITNSYIEDSNLNQHNLLLESIDIQNYKTTYEPSLDGKFKIVVEATDYQGNILYGKGSFVMDTTKPELQLNMEDNKIILISNENIGQFWLKEQLTEVGEGGKIIKQPTIEFSEDKVYINYVYDTPGGFSPHILYNIEYSIENNRFEDQKIMVNGAELLISLENEIDRDLGNAVYIRNDPILLKDSEEDIYTIYGYETNHMKKGIHGIGIRKLNKTTGEFEIINDGLKIVNNCDSFDCDPVENGEFFNFIEDIKAKIDKNDNIHLFWKEGNDEVVVGGYIFTNYVIYYRKIDTNGNVLIEDIPLVYLSNPNPFPNSWLSYNYDFDIDSENNVYLFWTEEVIWDVQTRARNYYSHYKKFDSLSGSWGGNINISNSDIKIYKIFIDKNDIIHLTYGKGSYGSFYGTLNSDNQEINKIRSLQTSSSNRENSFIISDNGNAYIFYQEFRSIGPIYTVILNYDFYNSKEDFWESEFFVDMPQANIGLNGLILDKINNFYSVTSGDLTGCVGVCLLTPDVLFRRLTNPPFVVITDFNGNEETIELEYTGGVWGAGITPEQGNSFIETYATDEAGNLGYASLGEISSRPQSKIVNNKNLAITGSLTMILQKNVDGNWVDEQIVVDNLEIVVPANGLIKLDIGQDNLGNQVFEGWNNLNIIVNTPGNYKVYAKFEVYGQIKESSWEFIIV